MQARLAELLRTARPEGQPDRLEPGRHLRPRDRRAARRSRCARVITLGSPFAGAPKASNAWKLYERASRRSVEDWPHRERMKTPPPVPATAIFSRSDGIVAWQGCLEREGPLSENIEVEGSHCGLGHNPAVLYAIADRLAQPEGGWRHFERSGIRSLIYRDPDAAGRARPRRAAVPPAPGGLTRHPFGGPHEATRRMDASFLYMETPQTPMHVAGLSIVELPRRLQGQLLRRLQGAHRLAPAPDAGAAEEAGAGAAGRSTIRSGSTTTRWTSTTTSAISACPGPGR